METVISAMFKSLLGLKKGEGKVGFIGSSFVSTGGEVSKIYFLGFGAGSLKLLGRGTNRFPSRLCYENVTSLRETLHSKV